MTDLDFWHLVNSICDNCCKRDLYVGSKDIYGEFNVVWLQTMYKKAKEDLSLFEKNLDKVILLGNT